MWRCSIRSLSLVLRKTRPILPRTANFRPFSTLSVNQQINSENSGISGFASSKSELDEAVRQSPFAADHAGAQSTGHVLHVNKGIATISGVASAHIGALVDFRSQDGRSVPGLVLSVQPRSVTAAILGSMGSVRVNDAAVHEGHSPAFPLGDVLGRVLDPIGRPIDGKGPIQSQRWEPCLDVGQAPSIVARAPCTTMIQSGLKHVDFFHSIARGLRVAVFGPRRSGKSGLAIDIIANQQFAVNPRKLKDKPSGSRLQCVYVCVGKSRAESEKLVAQLTQRGCMAYTTVIVATEVDPLGLQYLAPFAGATFASDVRDSGGHALVVYDDLAAHGDAYSRLAKSCSHPIDHPSYVHARLLERSAQLSADRGGGSASALVLAESDKPGQDSQMLETLSGFVDQRMYLDPELTMAGVWPPISCSTVVGKPAGRFQPRALRFLAGPVHTQLLASEHLGSQYKWAAEFGIQPEEEDRPVLEYARKLQQLLSQTELMPLAYQYLSVYAASLNLLVEIPLTKLADYETRLHAFVDENYPELLARLSMIRPEDELPKAVRVELHEVVSEFRTLYLQQSSVHEE